MRIGTGVFREALKAIEPNRVGEEFAVEAVNCDLRTGAIVPMRAHDPEWTAPAGTERIHLWQGKVACFTNRAVSVLPHPNNENLVWSGPGYGQYPLQASAAQFFDGAEISLPTASSRFGVAAPPQAPVVIVEGVAAAGADLLRSTAYRFSAVAGTGEESGLSLPSSNIDVYDGQTAKITRFWPLSGGDPVVPAGVTKIRVYRVETDQYGTPAWMFVAELLAATASWTDSVMETEEVAQTDRHMPPVGFKGLADLGNGITVGWKDRDLYLSEVGFPAAYPTKYKQRTNSPVVGIGVTGGFGIVLTEGRPYLLTAQTPESSTFVELQYAAPCLSARSIFSTEIGVGFASTDGLMRISSGGVLTNMTDGILTREQWAALNPESMICAVHDGKIYGFKYGTTKGWMLDPRKQGIVDLLMPAAVSDAHADEQGDRLLILDGAEAVGGLGEGDTMTARWKSAEWIFANAQSLAVARVIGDQDAEHPATLKVWRDGALHFTRTGITSSRPFMLPPGLYLSAQYEISCTARVRVAHLASDVDELAR